MAVKIRVTRTNDPDFKNVFEFSQDLITIGRDRENNVYLPDELKVVGRDHAKLKMTAKGYALIDLGSKNFTFLNDDKVDAGQEYLLADEDQIKCGDFILSVTFVKELPRTTDATVILENPFDKSARQFINALNRLFETYAMEAPGAGRRDPALRQALLQELEKIPVNDAGDVIAQVLNEKFEHQKGNGQQFSEDDEERGLSEVALFELLLHYMAKMLQGYLHFRINFFEETYVDSKKRGTDVLDLRDCTGSDIKSFLSSPELSDEQRKKREVFLKGKLEELMHFQLAMLEGYKACVQKGASEIVSKLDPETLKSQIRSRKLGFGPLKLSPEYIPIYFHLKLLKLYEKTHKELMYDDHSFVERKIFRPAFIEGYHKHMESLK